MPDAKCTSSSPETIEQGAGTCTSNFLLNKKVSHVSRSGICKTVIEIPVAYSVWVTTLRRERHRTIDTCDSIRDERDCLWNDRDECCGWGGCRDFASMKNDRGIWRIEEKKNSGTMFVFLLSIFNFNLFLKNKKN